jgi:two-component system, NtrC family, sensor histidine kinase KinB
VKSFFSRLLYARNLYFLLLDLRSFLGRSFVLVFSICCLAGYIALTYTLLVKVDSLIIQKTAFVSERISNEITSDINTPAMRDRIAGIIVNSEMPVIVTDTAWLPVVWEQVPRQGGSFFQKHHIGTQDTGAETKAYVARKVADYRKRVHPWPIYRSDKSGVLGYVIFGKSAITGTLTWFFSIIATLFLGFTIFMYVSSYNMRMNERSNLWVALAKETAHQLGTPLTALMGWVEYLRSTGDSESTMTPAEMIGQIDKICSDMDNDLSRLRKISSRFSQIGSVPMLKPCDVNAILSDCLDYFKIRLPLLRRKILIQQQFGRIPLVNANSELLEWVFENLLKNSVDAIQHEAGKIEITTEYLEKERIVRVYHGDNGKGITWEAHKKIFSPGFTTKKRGWGLGLTLAKRIVEDYHQGKIFVQWSKKNKGTIFCIDLPLLSDGKTT